LEQKVAQKQAKSLQSLDTIREHIKKEEQVVGEHQAPDYCYTPSLSAIKQAEKESLRKGVGWGIPQEKT